MSRRTEDLEDSSDEEIYFDANGKYVNPYLSKIPRVDANEAGHIQQQLEKKQLLLYQFNNLLYDPANYLHDYCFEFQNKIDIETETKMAKEPADAMFRREIFLNLRLARDKQLVVILTFKQRCKFAWANLYKSRFDELKQIAANIEFGIENPFTVSANDALISSYISETKKLILNFDELVFKPVYVSPRSSDQTFSLSIVPYVTILNSVSIKKFAGGLSQRAGDLSAVKDYHSEVIVAASAHIEVVKKGTFIQQSNLKSLSLTKNLITTITQGIFSGLPRLILLDLSHNLISNIEQEAFAQLPNLQILNLSSNELSWVTASMFTNPKLQRVSLSPNKFRVEIAHDGDFLVGSDLSSISLIIPQFNEPSFGTFRVKIKRPT